YVMGSPGAGKGTQAKMLAQELGYHQFSTGDAFREMARQDTPLGRKVNEIIHGQGKLMPGEDAAQVVIEAVKKHANKKGLIFDGTPRTLIEANIVDEFFKQNGYGRPLAIRLLADKEDIIARNTKRRYCLDIKGDFPVNTPQDEARCRELGGRVGLRADDTREKIEARWQEFETKTLPVIERYKKEGILYEVDGKKSIPGVHQQVMAVIEKVRSQS
ncbi:MAG: nucleoside monophosphate kinase, partial [Patescibacteria group bacterium]